MGTALWAWWAMCYVEPHIRHYIVEWTNVFCVGMLLRGALKISHMFKYQTWTDEGGGGGKSNQI